MIGHLYYITGLIIFIISLSNTIYYLRYLGIMEWIKSYERVSGSKPLKDKFRTIDDYNIYVTFKSFFYIELFWLILGVITKSWIIFLILIGLQYILKIISDNSQSLFSKVFGYIINLIQTIATFTLIINHFHLHINWIDLI